MMHRAMQVAYGLDCMVCLVLGAREARACSPVTSPDYTVFAPHAGSDRAPADAAVMISGYSLGLWGDGLGIDATVDGVEAAVEIDQTLSQIQWDSSGYLLLALRVAPTPTPGQTVHIGGNPCNSYPCEPLDLTFVATESEPVVPPTPGDMWWEARHAELSFEEVYADYGCAGYTPTASIRVFLRPTGPLLAADSAFVRVELVRRLGGELVGGARGRAIIPSADVSEGGRIAPDFLLGFSFDRTDFGYPANTDDLCVRVETVDASGRSSEPVIRCGPCVRNTPSSGDTCYPDMCPVDLHGPELNERCGGCSVGPSRLRSSQRDLAAWFGALLLAGALNCRRRGQYWSSRTARRGRKNQKLDSRRDA